MGILNTFAEAIKKLITEANKQKKTEVISSSVPNTPKSSTTNEDKEQQIKPAVIPPVGTIFTPEELSPIATVKSTVAPKLDSHIGDLAVKYETGKKFPASVGFISNGASWGDPGGDSYGPYQLETKKGTMQDYLRGKDEFVQALNQSKVNSAQFRAKWKALAAADPEGFQQSQFEFLCKKKGGHNDAMAHAKSLGWATDSFALASAIFSTSNQSGGWKTGIFNKAGIKKTDSVKTQINKLYDARAKYFQSLSSLSSAIKKAIITERTVNERADCLKLIL